MKDSGKDLKQLHNKLVNKLLKGKGTTLHTQRKAAFDNSVPFEPLRTLIEKVAIRAHKITDEDINEVKKSGLSEDQIFELIVCAAVGQGTRQYENALDALAKAVNNNGENSYAS